MYKTICARSEREESVARLCLAERRGSLLRSRCRKAAGRPASTLACERVWAGRPCNLGQSPIQKENSNEAKKH